MKQIKLVKKWLLHKIVKSFFDNIYWLEFENQEGYYEDLNNAKYVPMANRDKGIRVARY